MFDNKITVAATPKKDMPDQGWVEGVIEGVMVQAMSCGRFAIFRRSGMAPKSGYKVYDSSDSLKEDFELDRQLRG